MSAWALPRLFGWLSSDSEDDFEDEYEEEESDDGGGGGLGPPGSLALGLLATVPWVLAYEWALASDGGGRRNVSEVLLGGILSPLGDAAGTTRVLLWIAVALVALWRCASFGTALGPRLVRTAVEGAGAALLMGPTLLLLGRLFGDAAPQLSLAEYYPESSPSLAQVAFVAGGAAYEEVCFRLAAFSALFLLARHLLTFFGAPLSPARFAAEVVGMLGSALVFAAFHLERFTAFVGWRGEAFDAALFFWRVLAGILLWALFRWRGLGVAVWAHALFNVGLVLGLGPAVLRTP